MSVNCDKITVSVLSYIYLVLVIERVDCTKTIFS